MESQHNQNILISWILWHFYEVPKFLFSVWENYLWFASYFFSLPVLLFTIFSPWRKYNWAYGQFDIKEYFNVFVSNIFSRIVGALCRLVLIIIGAIVQVFIFLAGTVVILFWFLVPFLSVALIVFLVYAF